MSPGTRRPAPTRIFAVTVGCGFRWGIQTRASRPCKQVAVRSSSKAAAVPLVSRIRQKRQAVRATHVKLRNDEPSPRHLRALGEVLRIENAVFLPLGIRPFMAQNAKDQRS